MNPAWPVEQNVHAYAQPACEEMQTVLRSPWCSISTASTSLPSCRRNSPFVVCPSRERCTTTGSTESSAKPSLAERGAQLFGERRDRVEVVDQLLGRRAVELLDAVGF